MLQTLIRMAIEELNKLNGEYQYDVIEGDEVNFPKIVVRDRPFLDIVVSDLDTIQSMTVTNNTIMLYEDGAISIISPANYTYHETYV